MAASLADEAQVHQRSAASFARCSATPRGNDVSRVQK
jgi:hypothetical protein